MPNEEILICSDLIKYWIIDSKKSSTIFDEKFLEKPIRLEIDESLLTEGKETVEKEILNALIAAHDLSTSTMKSRMEELTGGLNLNLPGLSDGN